MAGHNEPIDLVVAARNDSSTSVYKLTIQLQQEITWSAKKHTSKVEKTLATVIIPPLSELGGFQWTPGKGNDRRQSVAPIEETVQQQLAAGAGTRFQLIVPANSLPTLQVENIKISHSVGIVVDTECCTAEPAVWVPLNVVPMTAAPEAQPGATSLVPPQTFTNNLPPQTAHFSAGPYGSAPTASYPNSYASSSMTYGSAQTVPYPNTNPPPEMTYGFEPGLDPDAAYRTQQPVPYASAVVEMDEYGHARPAG